MTGGTESVAGTATGNRRLTAEYLDVVRSLGGDVPSRRAAAAFMEASTAVVHGTVVESSFLPKLFDDASFRILQHAAATMYSIMAKVTRRYVDDPSFRGLFELDARLEELIALPRGYDAVIPVCRVDVFFDEDAGTVKFCELNTDGTSGMNENREITRSILPSESLREFARRHRVEPCELVDSWVRAFAEDYRQWAVSHEGAPAVPAIAICDYLEKATLSEFEVYRQAFREAGFSCAICDIRDLRFEGGRLLDAEGGVVDAVWRRAVTSDVLARWDESRALLEAATSDAVCLIGSFAGSLTHDKQVFRVLHDPRAKAILTDEERAFVEATVPFTAFLAADSVDLAAVKASKDRWVIKPSDLFDATDVFLGCMQDQKTWEALVDRFADGASGVPFLLQEFVTLFKTEVLPPDAGILEADEAHPPRVCPQLWNNLSGLYLYNGEFVGVFSRQGPRPIITGNMTAATLWVDRCKGASEAS